MVKGDSMLDEIRKKAMLGGGEERIKKQHEKGKLTARERIEKLLDEGSFVEIGMFAESRATEFGMDKKRIPGDGVITGYGTIDGRLVFVYAQDFTVLGGSLGEIHAHKIASLMDLAMKNGAPIIGINDSGGARIQEGVDSLKGYGEIFFRNTMASGVVPQIALIAGPCAGGAVYSPAIMDFTIMVDKTSYMFITGPQVIKAVTGEEIDFESLGGGKVHTSKSGNAHLLARDEDEAFQLLRKLLSYIPQNNMEDPPREENDDPPDRIDYDLDHVIPEDPKKSYDVHDVINRIFDRNTFFEIQPHFAPNIVIGFARLYGKSVGIVANQPAVYAGVLDIDASDKAARFVRFCDAFNIPIITLVDVPGYMPGVAQEHRGIIRHGAKLLYAYSEATVPKITVIMRKAYGGAYIAMGSKHLRADVVYAWPNAEIAVMGPEGAVNIVFRKEIKDSENSEKRRNELVEEYRNKFANPYIAASRLYVDDVIYPHETRVKLIQVLNIMENKREDRPMKKHGNIPL